MIKEIIMKRQILDVLREHPSGLRKREIASYTNTWVGNLIQPIAELENEGKIKHSTYRDMANFEWYDIYTIKEI